MEPTEIRKDIYSLRAVDWNARDFHGYSIYKGTTYNAYLIKDEKVTLFDTVKKGFKDDLLSALGKVIDPAEIDYLVVNHVEMDHSGSLPELMDIIRPEKLYCSSMGKKALLQHFGREDWPYQVAEPDSVISLGRRTVRFIETRMLHWPDSMFSYVNEDRLLISSDAFGQHWATSACFDDEVDNSELIRHAAKYYANILLLFSPLVKKVLARVRDSGLEIEMIAPDHGLVWRNPQQIIAAYDEWSRQEPKEKKALIIYDTMWHSTEMMAKAVLDGFVQEGVTVKLMNMAVTHRSDVMAEVLGAKALLFGSATLNNGILPRMADLLTYMKGLRPSNRIGAAFGSYGWSGEAVSLITRAMEEMKMKIVAPAIKVQYVPTDEDLKLCVELGRTVAKAMEAGS